jgi:WD40 repeat protein
MQETKKSGEGPGSIVRRRRALSSRVRLALLLLSASLGGWFSLDLYQRWTSWPSRLVLQFEQGHHPIAFTPDGSSLLTRGFWGKEYLRWDLADAKVPAKWRDGRNQSRFSMGALSLDGKTFASPWFAPSAGKKFSVDLIDVGSGNVRSTYDSPWGGCLGIRFKADGQVVRLLVASPKLVQVVDADVSGGQVQPPRTLGLPGSMAFLGLSAMSDDGRFLVVAGSVGPTAPGSSAKATIWDLDLDREAFRLPGLPGGPLPDRAAISSRSKSVALGFGDGSIEIWDLATCRLRATSREHRRGFRPSGLTFSPDGSILASHGEFRSLTLSFGLVRAAYKHVFRNRDRSVVSELILLDSGDGRPLIHAPEFGDVVFSADGRSLATSHEDGAVRIHDVPKQ